MYIFLDANILFKDPFFESNYNRQLMDLVRKYTDEVRILISRVVLQEARNNYEKELKGHLRSIKDAAAKIKYLAKESVLIDLNFSVEECLSKFDALYGQMESDGIIEVIDYGDGLLSRLVDRAIEKVAPFFEGGKNEFRDAIIWLSYADFVNENVHGSCYFITDNVKEFSRKRDKDEIPVPIHPGLLNDLNNKGQFKMYRSVQGLLQHDKELQSFIDEKREEEAEAELTAMLEEHAKSIDESVVREVIEDDSHRRAIESALIDYIDNMDTVDIDEDYHVGGYVQPSTNWIEFEEVTLSGIEVYGEEILVSATCEFEYDVDVYLYNPVYDSRDEKYQFHRTDTVWITVPISFSYTKDKEIGNFEIEGDINLESVLI